MTIEGDLVSWAAGRHDWQRDVLARLCRQLPIEDAAIAAIADRLIAGEPTPWTQLATADIPGNTVTAAGVQIVALRDLTGVNALTPSQQLMFGDAGITIIYGHNASGKSGYARVIKIAVGARVCEDILSDVFASGGITSQSAVIEYRMAGTGPDHQWKWPGSAASPQLQQVHFFDEANGDAYLSTESEITYRPSALVLLDQLIVVCDAVRTVLDQRLREVDANKQPMPVLPSGTPASRFLTELTSTTTDMEIASACDVPAEANERLGWLLSEEARLKASDPSKERDHLIVQAGYMEIVAEYCEQLANQLNTQALVELTRLRSAASELRAAAIAASAQNFDAEPVLGVGSTAWRALWDAARAFSENQAYHEHEFPVTGDSARCVLCHQQLSAEAADRLRRFHAFMVDRTERDAAKAEQDVVAARQVVEHYGQMPPAVATALEQIRGADAQLARGVADWISHGLAQAVGTVGWLDGAVEEQPTPVSTGAGETLNNRAQQLRQRAAAIDAATFDQHLRSTSQQVAALQGQIALGASKETITREVRRLQNRSRIEAARKATETGTITRKSSDLTRDHVTREVRDQFTRESDPIPQVSG